MQRPCNAIFFIFASLLTLGCEENLAPRSDLERYFSLYGVLSPDLGIQSIRVYAVEGFLTLDAANPDDILFTSTDLVTQEERIWEDSLQFDQNGQTELIYWSPFRAEYGHSYLIEATRLQDGVQSWAVARVPPRVDFRVLDGDSAAVRVVVEGEQIRLLNPEVGYVVNSFPNPERGPMRQYTISYQGAERQVEGAWQVTIVTTADRRDLQSRYNVEFEAALGIACNVLELRSMTFDAIVGDAAWDPPNGEFDAMALSFPEAMSNVENGFGFVTGGYQLQRALFPRREAVEYACFNYVW